MIRFQVSVSSDPQAIFEHVDRECLPTEYGGTHGTMHDIIVQMEAKMLKYRDYFQQSLHFGANEKLREDNTDSLQFSESQFGLDGSFRMLDID